MQTLQINDAALSSNAALAPSSLQVQESSPKHIVVKYPYIDALRGYAVLLVILAHTGGMFPQLPYPVKKITNLGWTGVELFFLVSCVTLMMSWRADDRKGIASPIRFWIRRFFRIAPMYYSAALFYLLLEPPAGGFDVGQFLATFSFINAWHPALLSTLNGGWRVVPGGWSISVEFSFYILFPLIIGWVRTPRSGFIFLGISCVAACVANDLTRAFFVNKYGTIATNTFQFFWLPNQLFVFALGTILFLAIDITKDSTPAWTKFHPAAQIGIIAVVIVILGQFPAAISNSWSYTLMQGLPSIFYATLAFATISFLLASNPQSRFVNKPIRELGKVSFSAYIFHFFVLHRLAAAKFFDASHQGGMKAILTCGLLFLMTLPITFVLSKLTFTYIEEPMIAAGSRLAARIG